ncbi:hypothetical protein GWI33_007660 [Rhynchophorus ferrugineus]|uniref:Uncharacterized protein n=1 Tax=Rhynchophorus ferrugineus TaxID=354439 RepID=A0A834IFR3_RHYFE|nr:hypothetical protein GWI33_007660 [Rhynchophorus ferrugineus]
MDIVHEFPFDELLDIVGNDIKNISRCLTVLIEISNINTFYEGPTRVSTTANFALSHLLVFQNNYPKDVFVMFLTLLKNITIKLHSMEKMPLIFKNTDRIFEAFIHIFNLDHFCKNTGKISIAVLTEVIKLKTTVLEKIEKYLVHILEKFNQLSLIMECDVLFDALIQRCYLETNVFTVCCTWILNCLKVIKNTDIRNLSNDSEQTCSFLRTTNNFYRKLSRVRHISKFKEINVDCVFNSFVNDLVMLAQKIIHLCGYADIEKDAKVVLAMTIFEFLNQDQRMTYIIETTIQHEVQELNSDVSGWWKKFSHSFFWMCHILYAKKW